MDLVTKDAHRIMSRETNNNNPLHETGEFLFLTLYSLLLCGTFVLSHWQNALVKADCTSAKDSHMS